METRRKTRILFIQRFYSFKYKLSKYLKKIFSVFVQYDDISAEDFLFVQTDIEYRKKWDNTAIALDIIDTDPKNSDSQIIYWEMLWPVSNLIYSDFLLR